MRRTRRTQGERGGVLLLTAVALPVLLIMTSFAVDLGVQRASRRTMQARADIIALDLVRLIDGRTASAIAADPNTETAIQGSASRNSVARSKITVAWGTVDANNTFFPATTATASAVKVTAAETTPRFFQAGHGSTSRSAVATSTGQACYELGTKLATINSSQSALLNGLLNQALGANGNINLSAATYQGLVGSGVSIGDLATQLGFGTPSQLAGATVNAKQFYLASATVLQNHGYTAAANVFNLIAAQTNSSLTVPVGKLMTIGAGGANDAALTAGFDAFNLLQGSAYAINGSSAISIPNMSLNVPNLSTTTVGLNVIQKPQTACGTANNAPVTTQQASLQVTPTVSTTVALGGLLNSLATITGTVPLTESVAGANGQLTAVACGTPQSIGVGVNPQPVSVSTGLNLTIKVLNIPLASVTTTVTAQPNGTSNGGTFLYNSQFLPPTGTGTMLDAPPTTLGLSGLLTVGTTQVTLLGVLPVGVTLTALTNAINTALSPILSALDSAVTGPVAHALGLELAGADIGALSMTCHSPELVG